LLLKAGLPPIRIHDLRHSYASIALARGVHPKVVQEALGHSTIAVTLDLYSHVVPSLQREAAKEMGVALFG
jgi:integrase